MAAEPTNATMGYEQRMATLALAGYRVMTKAEEAHLLNQFGIVREIGEPYLYWVRAAKHIAWLEWEELPQPLLLRLADVEFSPALYTAIMDLDVERLVKFVDGGRYSGCRPEF